MLNQFKCSAASISPPGLAPRLSKHYLGPTTNDISTILEFLPPPCLDVTNTLAQFTRAIVCNWPPLQCRRHLWMVPFADKNQFMSKLHITTAPHRDVPGTLLGPVLREDGGRALRDLAHAREEVEPGDGDLAQRRLVRKNKSKQTAESKQTASSLPWSGATG